ncbi:myrosinase 1-like [Rhodnius prolixus]|uniref:myrosinase 1-like n=1 Tax=Rhodnius prolixus TaxID=13249 RepID=UPI003D1883C5
MQDYIMHSLFILIAIGCIYCEQSLNHDDTINVKIPFPKGFHFSAATASYQIEGAWNESGKGENIWDRMVHTNPSFVYNEENGDVACDSYHKYKEDVQLIKDIGFKFYRFSLSWSRILPNGTKEYINQAGIDYYNNLIDDLLANSIQPMVTIYHWDLPQPLEDLGGWLNSSIILYFEDYAKVVFSTFGDRVKWWLTINEPISITAGYGDTEGAPALNLHGTGDYLAGHNLLRAHAKAYRLYDKMFKPKQRGRVSFAMDGPFAFPQNNTLEDHIAAERWNQFSLGWFLHPVYSVTGDYPPVMRDYVDRNSASEGLPDSRLPYFTQQEIKEIQGTYDFMGLNHYTSTLATNGVSGQQPSRLRDANVQLSVDPNWPTSQSTWLRVVPVGFRGVLNWVKDQYNNPEVFVTENGFSDFNITQDYNRISYYQNYLSNLSAAIYEDGCNVIGYTAWSLMDNFEWRAGYSQRFGIVQVDFDDPNRPRTKKASAEFFKKLIASQKT